MRRLEGAEENVMRDNERRKNTPRKEQKDQEGGENIIWRKICKN